MCAKRRMSGGESEEMHGRLSFALHYPATTPLLAFTAVPVLHCVASCAL